jgi:hypothetical protein
MVKYLLPLLFLVSSCSKQGDDGFTFAKKETNHPTITVHIQTYATDEELNAAAKARGVTAEVHAWGVLRGNECTIHVRDPLVAYQPEFIGHEISHCIWGRFHE